MSRAKKYNERAESTILKENRSSKRQTGDRENLEKTLFSSMRLVPASEARVAPNQHDSVSCPGRTADISAAVLILSGLAALAEAVEAWLSKQYHHG